jgi:hypothetical protein
MLHNQLKYYYNTFVSRCIFIPAVCFLLFSCTFNSNTQNNAQIHFNKTQHDFGTVDLNSEVSHDFAFTNPGEETLMIQDIQTSCGCTVPEWPKKPIKKGEDKKIHIAFDADFPGAFRKTITVYYNGENSPDTLFIKGKIEQAKTSS